MKSRVKKNSTAASRSENPFATMSRTLCVSASAAAVILLIASSAWTKVEYDTSSLLLKNSDQISEMIKVKIKKAQALQAKQEDNEDGEIQAEPEALENLKDAMRIALSRPDQDGARSNLYSRVRRELVDLNSLDEVLAELTEESLAELRTQEGPRRTATYVVILENMMAELKPEMSDSPVYRKIFERIRDAKISITDKSKVQNLLRSMSIPISPSDTAAKFLASKPAPAPTAKKKK
jgi:hypothetical protein